MKLAEFKPETGFTLVELLIVLAVATLLLGIALPEFSSLNHRNRINAAASDLYVSLQTARTEAIKRRISATVCPTTDNINCTESGIDWSNGWMVFIDSNGNGDREYGEEVFKVVPTPHDSVRMQAAQSVDDYVRFNSTGDAFGTAGEFRLCHFDTNAESMVVSVTSVGRVELTTRIQTDCNRS